jgi:hypothetical protein
MGKEIFARPLRIATARMEIKPGKNECDAKDEESNYQLFAVRHVPR